MARVPRVYVSALIMGQAPFPALHLDCLRGSPGNGQSTNTLSGTPLLLGPVTRSYYSHFSHQATNSQRRSVTSPRSLPYK